MFLIKAVFCRAVQTAFRIALPLLPYREPEIVDSCEAFAKVCKKEKISSTLIVTDKGIVAHGLTTSLEKMLKENDISFVIYDNTQPNPTVCSVEEALEYYHRYHCDALIAVGGGSSMDCAKAVGARVAYPKRTVGQMKGILRVLRKLPVLIAIPTTAGTGSEVTLASVITDGGKQHKYAMMSFPLIPSYAVLDASLTCSLPPYLTATTGMDALTHAVEAYIGRSTTRQTRRLALESVRLIFQNVEVAYTDGYNRRARSSMLLAAYKAGIAFSKSYVGYVHAVAHSLGGQYGIAHGLANAVVLPYILEAYGKSIYKQLNRLGMAAGVCQKTDTDEDGAKKFIAAVKGMNIRMGIPDKLPGIRKEDIPVMAKHAEREANPLYPVPKLMTRRELEEFYYQIADWSEKA